MNAPFQFTPQATENLDAIWWFIAERSRDAADRVEMEIVATCRRLAKHPLIGTQRQDITPLAVRFWTVTKFPKLGMCLTHVATSACGLAVLSLPGLRPTISSYLNPA